MTTTMNAEAIARALGGATRTGGQWKAKCPVHADQVASLALRDSPDGLLWKCHAGCSQADVMTALRDRQLLADRDTVDVAPRRRIVATYDYRDESGTLLYQTVRYAPKDFRQRRPTPGGDWVWSLNGIDLVPYRLPDMVANPTARVWVVEGEKDADNLAALGLVATCNPMGAGKWPASFDPWFALRDVALIGDNDKPGREHVNRVANLLAGAARTVRIVTLDGLADKADVSDWLAAGGTRERLEALADAAPVVTQASAIEVSDDPWDTVDTPMGSSPDSAPWDVTIPAIARPGILGELLDAVEDGTEADPSAVLFTLLAACGIAFGLGPRLEIGGTTHHARTHLLIVGRTAEGRKGESWGVVQRIMREAIGTDIWNEYEVGGLSSGEGLIAAVEDGEIERGAPVPEKRRIVFETEFARTMRVSRREANTLSSVIRQAWDATSFGLMTRAAKRATNVHLAIVGQITPEELRTEVNLVDQQNGLLNRFLLCYSHRRVLRPSPTMSWSRLAQPVEDLRKALHAGQGARLYDRDREADALWRDIYFAMNDLSRPIPAVEARGAPMIARLSLLYALLNGHSLIRADDLRAAVEIWWYAVQSQRRAYGERAARFGDAVADAILREFREHSRIEGTRPVFTLTEISGWMHRNAGRAGITQALALLAEHGLLERVRLRGDQSATRGRPAVNWRMTDVGVEPFAALPRWLEVVRD